MNFCSCMPFNRKLNIDLCVWNSISCLSHSNRSRYRFRFRCSHNLLHSPHDFAQMNYLDDYLKSSARNEFFFAKCKVNRSDHVLPVYFRFVCFYCYELLTEYRIGSFFREIILLNVVKFDVNCLTHFRSFYQWSIHKCI